MTTEDEHTYDEQVSLMAAFLKDMLKAKRLCEVEIMDAFEGAIMEYRKVVKMQGEQARSAERWMKEMKEHDVD